MSKVAEGTHNTEPVRPGPVSVGDARRFRSTLQNEDGKGILVRLYTDQVVEVIEHLAGQGWNEDGQEDEDDGPELMFLVRAADGVEFSAWESELTRGGSNVYVSPDGAYVDNPEWVPWSS